MRWPRGRSRRPPTTMSSTLSPTDFDSLEIQGQYSDINNRWDLPDSDWDNDSSSARLFERSRIKALAARCALLLVWEFGIPDIL
ncbi:Spectrin beta chain, brain 2 [Myotis brandtii]|uniref:Spectrin beta chain, brain 2 n=2 Tax=Myotis TaxID=9434 RepID=S7PF45_MYOBR|nr:Spectrin beta chain, brain 2 [Myotis brandtii]